MIPTLSEMVHELGFVRLAGTAGERSGASLIEKWILQCGFSVVRESFPIETFADGKAEIRVGGKVWRGLPLGRCRSGVTRAPLIFTENPKGVNLAPEHHRGKVLLSYGRPRGIYHELKDAGIAAMLTITPPYRQAYSLSHRQYEETLIPTVTLTYDDAAEIANYDGQECEIEITQTVIPSEAFNLRVLIPGSSPDGTTTYLVGHYDSVDRSPGACDNAGGTAVLVYLAHEFAHHPPVRDTEIIFFSGEELGLIGSQAYCNDHMESIRRHGRFVLNVDVSGDDLGTDELYVTGTKELLGFAAGMTRAQGVVCNTRISIYSSDSIPFARLGIPSVNLARYGGKASFYGHTPDDAPERISERGLQNTFKAAIAMMDPILRGAIYPVDRVIDESLRPALENYVFGLTGKEPKLEWPPAYYNPPGV